MRATGLALLAAGMITVAASHPAEARDYRYCLTTPNYGYPGDCSYDSYAQCRASASGRYADCNLNPRLLFNEPPPPRRHYRTYRSHPDY